jgi:acetyltransferase-like isoleucine patch superfamily enzyme
MDRLIKKILKFYPIKKSISSILKCFFGVFYNKKYLTGRWFEKSYLGYIWAFKGIMYQKILGFNRNVPWPISLFIFISNPSNIVFHPDDLNNFQTFGCYYQNFSARIYIGHGTYIAPNVGFITANHDPNNPDDHLPGQDIIIGKNCWIGMNSVILPGVKLGDHTVVAAGSVVGKNKKFEKGYQIIGGNPAQVMWAINQKKN